MRLFKYLINEGGTILLCLRVDRPRKNSSRKIIIFLCNLA